MCDPSLLKVLDQRYEAVSDEVQCLCLLSQSKRSTSTFKDRGRTFWINYRDLLLNHEHATELEKFESSLRPAKTKKSEKEPPERKRNKRST